MMTFVMSNEWNGSSLQEQLLMFRPVCVYISVPRIVLLKECDFHVCVGEFKCW